MNDRLSELTGAGAGSRGVAYAPFEVSIDANEAGNGGVTWGGGGGGAGGGGFMEAFFEKVNSVKKDIDAVKKVRRLFKLMLISHLLWEAVHLFVLRWKRLCRSMGLEESRALDIFLTFPAVVQELVRQRVQTIYTTDKSRSTNHRKLLSWCRLDYCCTPYRYRAKCWIKMYL